MPRPTLHIKTKKSDYLLEAISALAVIILVALPFIYYNQLPDEIPTHFNVKGEPDDFGSKALIWIFPLIGLILYVAMTLLSRFPHKLNYPVEITEENACYQYKNAIKLTRTVKLFVVLVILFITYKSIAFGLEKSDGLGVYFLPFFLLLIFGTLAVYVINAIRNKRVDDHLR